MQDHKIIRIGDAEEQEDQVHNESMKTRCARKQGERYIREDRRAVIAGAQQEQEIMESRGAGREAAQEHS